MLWGTFDDDVMGQVRMTLTIDFVIVQYGKSWWNKTLSLNVSSRNHHNIHHSEKLAFNQVHHFINFCLVKFVSISNSLKFYLLKFTTIYLILIFHQILPQNFREFFKTEFSSGCAKTINCTVLSLTPWRHVEEAFSCITFKINFILHWWRLLRIWSGRSASHACNL